MYTDKEYSFRGLTIRKDVFGKFVVFGNYWGDQIGENIYTFRTLRAAKEFINRMASEWKLEAA